MKTSNRNQTGVIFNIQKFSINDGPGIRTVVFFKGCPLHCRWCSNPESQFTATQLFWEQKKCVNCLHCINICPTKAVSFFMGRIHIDHGACAGCGTCVSECPGKALEMQGEVKTVQQVLDIVLQDQVFYEEGGGITLSGGEFLSQPVFAEELLIAAKEEGLHTCGETTGFAASEVFKRVISYVDEVLFDMKHWNAQKHMKGTGVSNELPFANLHTGVLMGKNILLRIPVIPGFNDSEEDAVQFAARLHEIGIDKCQLLPFHQFGENKYHLLGKSYDYKDVPSLHREDLQSYITVFQENNINAFF